MKGLFKIISGGVLLSLLILGLAATQAFAAGGKEELPTLKFWFPGNTPRELDAVLAEVNNRIREEVGAKVQFNFVPWGDYHNKLRALVAAGEDYEAHFDGDWGAIPTMAPQGAFLAIEDLLPKYAPNIWKTVEKDKWEGAKYGGHIIGIPWRWPKSERRSVQIRYDLYKKYGLKEFDTLNGDVFTLDDYEQFLASVARNEPGMFGVAPTAQWMSPFSYIGDMGALNEQWNIVYDLGDSNLKLKDLELTDFYKAMIRRFRKWYLSGYFEKDVLAQKEDYKDLMIAGKAASIVHIFDSENELTIQIKPNHPDWEVKAHLLRVDKVGPLSPPMNNILLFNKNGKNPEKAIMFWEWMHKSQDNYDLVMYGIKGKHWNEGPNRTVVIPAPYTMADSPYYGWHGRWCAYWPELERPTANDLPGWMNKVMKATYINDRVPPHVGFFPELGAIKNEIAQRYSLKENIGRALELGVLDPEAAYADYVAKQAAAGRDKILAELQRQMDKWLANK
jgi:putative aldouronate transport system substrate-binding protein